MYIVSTYHDTEVYDMTFFACMEWYNFHLFLSTIEFVFGNPHHNLPYTLASFANAA